MKKVLVCAMVIGIASMANAAEVRMNFVGGGDAFSGTSAQVELWLDLPAGQQITAIGGYHTAIAGDPLEMTNYVSAIGNDAASISYNVLGFAANFGTFWAGGEELTGPGSFLVGTKTIAPTANAVLGETYGIMFDKDAITLTDEGGAQLAFKPATSSFPGYWAFGDYGSPEVKKPNGTIISEASPLLFTYVPEPASLALLALGGIAVLRRR